MLSGRDEEGYSSWAPFSMLPTPARFTLRHPGEAGGFARLFARDFPIHSAVLSPHSFCFPVYGPGRHQECI